MPETRAETTRVLQGVHWYRWNQAPVCIQRCVLEYLKSRAWSAASHPAPMLLVHSNDRKISQDVCRALRSHLTSIFDFEIIVPYENRAVVLWFNPVGSELAAM